MIRFLEANMSYKNSKEKLIKVRNKVLQPETESFIEAKKRLYKDRTYTSVIDDTIYNPFDEYQKWLGVLGGQYAGAGLARSIVKEHLIHENPDIAKMINSVSIDTFGAMGEPIYNKMELEEFEHYWPYDHGAPVKITVTLVGHSSYRQNKEIDSIKRFFDDYLIMDDIAQGVAEDFFINKEQISFEFKTRSREQKFEFLMQKRLKLLQHRFASIGKLHNKKNYTYSIEDWLPIKEEIITELVTLIEKFEGTNNAESFRSMLEMFKNYQIKKEALDQEPRN
jgi:hypothetical protein